MNETIYKLVYCSRNQIGGTAAEILAEVEKILAASRRNNPKVGITGALLFNEGLFAQALEGPLEAVEQTFERIQQDPRHSDVTVLQSGPGDARDFSDWSMAFAASESKTVSQSLGAAFRSDRGNHTEAGGDVIRMLRELVAQEDWMMA